MIYEYLSCNFLSTDHIYLSGCLFFVRYCEIWCIYIARYDVSSTIIISTWAISRTKILIFLKSQEIVLSVKQRRNQGTRKHFFSILVFFHRQWKGKDHLYSSLPHATAHEHPDFYLHLCIWSILRANILHFDHSEFSSQIKLSRSINS